MTKGMIQLVRFFGVMCSVLLLAGCPAPAEDALNVGSGVEQVGVNVIMTIESTGFESNSVPVNDLAKVKIVFLDESLKPLVGEIINLSATSGTLSQTSVLTDSLGQATVTITPPAITDGTAPGVFTATPESTGEAVTFNYQFTAGAAVKPQLNLTMTVTSTGTVSNSIPVTDSANVNVEFLSSSGAPLANEIINLSSTSGTLSQTSVLTDSLGQVTATLPQTASTDGTAPGVFTATPESTGEAVTFNYQFTAGAAVKPQLNLTMTVTSTGTVSNSIPVTDSANVNVEFLSSSGAPLANEIINLSATSGTLSQTSVLTDSLGQATVTITPPAITDGTAPGVFTATPESTGEAVTFNYQFTATVTPESASALQFVSANPTLISLKGTGGFGYGESSLLTFKVVDELSNPVGGVEVSFTLTTSVGGLSLTENSAISSSEGLATVTVVAGTVSTPVRVTASIVKLDGSILSVQSDVLTVTTGIPDQNSFDLVPSKLASEGLSFNGDTVEFFVYLADRNNNPIPDGTVVNFTTEGGAIESSCQTTNGECSVTWKSQNPRPSDHRSTILAYAIGNETFYDFNGSGIFDDGDGFDDLAEAFRDDDEMGTYNPGEISFSLDEKLIDYNQDGVFTVEDGVFNGVPCNHATDCPPDPNNIVGRTDLLVNLRASTVLIMASSSPRVHLYELLPGFGSCLDTNGKFPPLGIQCQEVSSQFAPGVDTKDLWVLIEDTAALCLDGAPPGGIIADGTRVENVVDPEDPACVYAVRQSAPTGSSISITSDVGTASITPSAVPNQTRAFEFTFSVTSTADNTDDVGGTLELVVTTPITGNIVSRSVALEDPAN